MSRQNYACRHCLQPVHDNRLYCLEYREYFRALLKQIPDLIRDLNVTLSKQDRISSGGGGGSRPKGHEKPLVYKTHASLALDRLVAQGVVKYARLVRAQFPLEVAYNMPSDPIARLYAFTDRISGYEWFGEMVTWFENAVTTGRAATDVSEARLEAGTCESCGTRVRGSMDSATYTCSGCGAVGDIVERQQQMWDAALALPVTPAQAEAYLGFFLRLETLRKAEGLPGVLGPLADQPFRGALVRLWATRGYLDEVGRYVQPGITPDEGWALYRFGDIIGLAINQLRKADDRKRAGEIRRAEAAARRAARQAEEVAA